MPPGELAPRKGGQEPRIDFASEQETAMRKLFFTTAVAAALVAYAGAASAQTTPNPSGPGAGAAAKSENTRPAESQGALSGALKGDTTGGGAAAESAKPVQDSPSGEKSQ
jgi:hypothetical protein